MSAILGRAQNPLKSSPSVQFFRHLKWSHNLMVSGMKNDLKIDPKKLVQKCTSTLGGALGTPGGSPGVPGAEIDGSGRQFGSIFESQGIKLSPKSTPRASQKLIPSYIIEFDELNRSRRVPKLENCFKTSQTTTKNLILLKIDSEIVSEADSEICYRVRHPASI